MSIESFIQKKTMYVNMNIYYYMFAESHVPIFIYISMYMKKYYHHQSMLQDEEESPTSCRNIKQKNNSHGIYDAFIKFVIKMHAR